jgi:triosephosphate isomerase (TIM)
MRQKFIAGNWKMYTSCSSAVELAKAVAAGVSGSTKAQVAVCPPFPWLTAVSEALAGSPVLLGGQDCSPFNEGAYTGSVSPTMLQDAGCQYVIIGHSERRHGLKESDDLLNSKLKAALAAGLKVIFCIGELLAEREENKTEAVLDLQLTFGLAGITSEQLANVVLAYEPVWAIGTGKVASKEQAQEAHAFIRKRVSELFNPGAAEALIIQYGGSVKPENAAALLGQPDVDGALVGGASLKADQFLAIINALN